MAIGESLPLRRRVDHERVGSRRHAANLEGVALVPQRRPLGDGHGESAAARHQAYRSAARRIIRRRVGDLSAHGNGWAAAHRQIDSAHLAAGGDVELDRCGGIGGSGIVNGKVPILTERVLGGIAQNRADVILAAGNIVDAILPKIVGQRAPDGHQPFASLVVADPHRLHVDAADGLAILVDDSACHDGLGQQR